MNEPEEADEAASVEATEDVPGQEIRERLSQASTEQKLLEVRTLGTEQSCRIVDLLTHAIH